MPQCCSGSRDRAPASRLALLAHLRGLRRSPIKAGEQFCSCNSLRYNDFETEIVAWEQLSPCFCGAKIGGRELPTGNSGGGNGFFRQKNKMTEFRPSQLSMYQSQTHQLQTPARLRRVLCRPLSRSATAPLSKQGSSYGECGFCGLCFYV